MNEVKAEYLEVTRLHPFEGHPFQVKDDEEMDRLVWSICTQGVLTPLVVRPMEAGEYEVISGHRRLYACRKAGIQRVPALIYPLSREEAAIAVVDANLHREHILPSEKAFAYKMKMEAMSRQGERNDLTSTPLVSKLRSNEIIGNENGESREQVRRYIRLTNLIPDILRKVDEGKIALTPAVELSYLTQSEQEKLADIMDCEDCTPSLSQAVQLKKLSQAGTLSLETMTDLMARPKANQQEKISFRMEDICSYFPKSFDAARIHQTILKLLQDYQKRRQREQSR